MAAGWRRRHRHPSEWSFALTSFAIFAIGVVFWGLVVFGNGNDRTLLHICSYLLPILGICGAIVGLRAVFPRFALAYVGIAAVLSLALYAPSLDHPAGSSYSAFGVIVVVASLAAFVALALQGDRRRDEPAVPAAVEPPGVASPA